MFKAALFGGSFDPPHIGHTKIIEEALKKLDIDMLFIVPTYLNPFKKTFHAPADIRAGWMKKLYEKNKKVKICDFEIKLNRPVAAIETVEYLYKEYNIEKLYLIIGADNLKGLHMWKNYEELKKKVEFVVANRDGLKIGKDLKKLDINVNISSSFLRQNLKKEYLPPKIANEIINYYKEKNG